MMLGADLDKYGSSYWRFAKTVPRWKWRTEQGWRVQFEIYLMKTFKVVWCGTASNRGFGFKVCRSRKQ
jgi:hypothetical protein